MYQHASSPSVIYSAVRVARPLVLWIIVFFRFLLVTVLSVLRYTDSDHHVDIFNSSSKPLCQEIKMYGVFEAFSVSCLIRTILQYYILLWC